MMVLQFFLWNFGFVRILKEVVDKTYNYIFKLFLGQKHDWHK